MSGFLHRFSKYSIFLTFFLDNLGLGIIFPIFTPLFFDPKSHFFKDSYSFSHGSILLGLLIAAFPLAQFFGAPLIGDLSDQIGRKKGFILTIIGSTVGYILMGVGLEMHLLHLLFLSRMLTGFFAGNLTICLASLVDMSKDESERTKNFSLLASIGGLSFIFSVAIGGFFSNPAVGKIFTPSLPFWIIAALFFINLCLLMTFFKESHRVPKSSHFHLLKGIHNILHAWKIPHLKLAYMVFFFYMIAWVTTVQFLPTYLMKYYGITPEQITYIFLGIGVIWGGANFLFSKCLSKILAPKQTLLVCLCLLSIFLALFLPDQSLPAFLFHFYFSVALSAVTWSNCLANVSLQTDVDIQGRILGINQSFAALASMLGPTLGGLITAFDPRLVYLFTTLSCAVAFIMIAIPTFRKKAAG